MSSDSLSQSTLVGHNINATGNASVSVVDLIIKNISSTGLITFTRQFLYALTHRDWNTARIHLDSLRSVGSLDEECKCLLEVLSYKLDLSMGSDCAIAQDVFLGLIRSNQSSDFIKDVVESIYIEYLSRQSESRARDRYINSHYAGSYSKAVFYEKLANIDELVKFVEDGIVDAFEFELCALVRGAIRCGDFILAINIANELNGKFDNNNSKIILSIAKALHLHDEIDGLHYFFISSSQMIELENQIELCIELAESLDEVRITQVAAILLAITYFRNEKLISICQKNIKEAENVVPNIRQFLSVSAEKNSSEQAKEILMKEVPSINEIEAQVIYSAWVSGDIKHHDIQMWIDNNGVISVSDPQVEAFIDVALKTLAYDPEEHSRNISLSETLDDYCKKYTDKSKGVNALAIYQLCQTLNELHLPIYIVKLLDSIIPQSPWCSPALDLYAEALLDTDQSQKLVNLIDRIDGVEGSYRFLAVKIRLATESGNFNDAIDLIKVALSSYNKSCYFWALLLRTYYLAGVAKSDISSSISMIPNSILSEYSHEGLRLLGFIAKTDMALAESYILEWFIDNPVAMAVHVTNLHFTNHERSEVLPDTSYPSKRCSQAVTYRAGKRQYTKLLVDNCGTTEYLLDTHTPIGLGLQETNINDSFTIGMESYTVIEKMPPIVGAIRISMEIRDVINPGTDCFYRFTIEDDGVNEILRHIDLISKQKQLIEPEIDGKPLSLLMRIYRTHKADLVRGAFLYLLDKESNKKLPLYSNGEVINQSVVLDILSLVYFSLTGFSHGLLRNEIKLYITRETFEIVSEWLTKTGSPDFLSIAKTEHGFIRTTAKDVAKDDSLNNLKLLLNSCDIISQRSFDMPEMMARVRDCLDISHYSSLKASISNSIPFLCFDPLLCSLYQQLNIELANTLQLVSDAHSKTIQEECRHVDCHVNYGLHVPILHNDLIGLCAMEGRGQYLASKLLKMYPNSYASSETALRVLVMCCLRSIGAASLHSSGSLSLSDWRYTEHIVYACCESAMFSLDGASYEARLAKLIIHVMYFFMTMKIHSELAISLFNRFAHGHFLDIEEINSEIIAYTNE